jgi:hypothetical protein
VPDSFDFLDDFDLGVPEARPMASALAAARPASREAALAEVEPERRRIYETVRHLLDEIEAGAPWSALYYPPDAVSEFFAMARRLLGLIRDSPARLQEVLDALRADLSDLGTQQTLDDIAFYVAGIHEMTSRDLAKLEQRLTQLGDGAAMTAQQRDALCELAADLKGKYTSAIMGATASIVAEGRWQGVEIEPLLFPEKAEEFARTRELFEDLQQMVRAIADLPHELPFPELRRRWLLAQRVDQYALADLPTFRGRLGRLLKERRRRALYSGDYRQIQRRERRLAARLNELEELHHLTWTATPGQAEAMVQVFERLAQLILEIAAVIDVALLEAMLGEPTVRKLRQVVVLEREEEKRLGKDADGTEAMGATQVLQRRKHPRRAELTDEQHSLIPLLHEEDLRTFFELLLGSVAKRSSLSVAATAQPAATAAAEPPVQREVAPPSPPAAPARSVRSVAVPSPGSPSAQQAAPAVGRREGPATAPPAASGRRRVVAPPPAIPQHSREERETAARLIQEEVARLRQPSSAAWNAFRMLQRLVEKQHAVPPSMLQAVFPFLHDLQSRLLPRLAAGIAVGDLEPLVAEALGEACRVLLDPSLGPQQIRERAPDAMARIVRLLDALEASSSALLSSSRSG